MESPNVQLPPRSALELCGRAEGTSYQAFPCKSPQSRTAALKLPSCQYWHMADFLRKIGIYMDFHVARAILDEFIHLVHKTGYVHFLHLKPQKIRKW